MAPRARNYVLVLKMEKRGGWFKVVPLVTNMDEEEKHFTEKLAELQDGNPNTLLIGRKIRCTRDVDDVVKDVHRKFAASMQNGWIKGKISDVTREIRAVCKK